MAILAMVAGCGLVQDTQDAEKVVAHHFQLLATNGVETALADYGDDFFKGTSREKWRGTLKQVDDKLGTFENYSTLNWNVSKNAGTTGSVTTVELICHVKYSRQEAQETFKLAKKDAETQFKIIAHRIDSKAQLGD